MIKNISLFSCLLAGSLGLNAQISNTAQDWYMPNLEISPSSQNTTSSATYSLIDINGDGFIDLVDADDQNTGQCWMIGQQRYWKVYKGNGTGISATAEDWYIPNLENSPSNQNVISSGTYSLIDINGDGFLDLVDADDQNTGQCWMIGQQRYWKVYKGNGTSISASSEDWYIPNLEFSPLGQNVISNGNYSLIDMNGDGFLDLVDCQDNNTNSVWMIGQQRYWKVYKGNGTGISATSEDWYVPNLQSNAVDQDMISNGNYSLIDINGDGFLDLVDCQDNNTNSVWMIGQQRYWKVYKGNGTGISATSEDWYVPNLQSNAVDQDMISNGNYSLIDMNGDGFLDLVDCQDNNTNSVWMIGQQRYWKVYKGNGTGISATSEDWYIPNLQSNAVDQDMISNGNYSLVDMNGDGKPDIVDAQDNGTNSVWMIGQQRFWKVYLNNSPGSGVSLIENENSEALSIYPNPSNGMFILNLNGKNNSSYVIYNMAGKIISEGIIQGENLNIDVSNENMGIYFISVTNENGTFKRKLVKN